MKHRYHYLQKYLVCITRYSPPLFGSSIDIRDIWVLLNDLNGYHSFESLERKAQVLLHHVTRMTCIPNSPSPESSP